MHDQHSGDHLMSFLNGTDPGLRQTRTPTTDNFAAGVDFTAGSTTQLTLSADPGTEDNVEITFDGIQQHRNTYSVSGAVVTFDAAIGAGVSNVEATFTTTIPAAEPADNSVTLAKLADGTQGDILYYGASGAPTLLGAGTSGQFLKTQGAGANPVWGTASAGKVLQVVSATKTAQNTYSSTSFTATGLTASITPSASSSKVLIQFDGYFADSTLAIETLVAVYRQINGGGYSVLSGSGGGKRAGSSNLSGPIAINFLDSPATTNQVDYQIYVKVDTGSSYFNYVWSIGGATPGSNLTLMEIGA
jgi:hypothetical protein